MKSLPIVIRSPETRGLDLKTAESGIKLVLERFIGRPAGAVRKDKGLLPSRLRKNEWRTGYVLFAVSQ